MRTYFEYLYHGCTAVLSLGSAVAQHQVFTFCCSKGKVLTVCLTQIHTSVCHAAGLCREHWQLWGVCSLLQLLGQLVAR